MNNKFYTTDYISPKRWESYWVQINEVLISKPRNVLEVGIGSGLVTTVLRNFGLEVKTVDLDRTNDPDIIGDVRKLPAPTGSFDTVLCCQVLEHLPFSDFQKAVKELARVAKKTVIISLPEPYSGYLYLGFKIIPFLPKIEWVHKLTLFLPKLKKNGPHFWEVGRVGSSLGEISEAFQQSGLKTIRTYFPNGNLTHRFFILEKE